MPGVARFRPRGQEDLAPSGTRARLRANLEALRTLHQVEADGRAATGQEQQVLARWSGWGAVPQVFDEGKDRFADERAELSAVLSQAEYAAARRSTVNAHYTDVALVEAMWAGMRRLGMQDEAAYRVLEPGCGVGHFIGTAPERARVTGVEVEPMTARIARLLYPDAQIVNESFADTQLRPGSAGVAIGNVPFGRFSLHDPVNNQAGHAIHNHFLLKSLHALRPGGVLMAITSRYTMDAQGSEARAEMAGLADLIAAVRLPVDAHQKAAGTSTVTDVLILRRRDEGEAPLVDPASWAEAVAFAGSDQVRVNQYFLDHPEHVLGWMSLVDGAHFAKEDLAVEGSDDAPVASLLGDALDRIATNAGQRGLRLTPPPADAPATVLATPTLDSAHPGRSPGAEGAGSSAQPVVPRPEQSILVNDDNGGGGGFSQLVDGQLVDFPVPASQRNELRALLRIRDLAVRLLETEATSRTDTDTDAIHSLRSELNTAYDAYVAAWGPVGRWKARSTGRVDARTGEAATARQRPRQGGFRFDPYAPLVRGLEEVADDGQSATKSAILTQRTLAPRTVPEQADTPADAVAICLDQYGAIRLPAVTELLGAESEQAAREQLGTLVFADPEQEGRLVPAAEYLSGPVRTKLAAATTAAEVDPDQYTSNVDALREVLPPDLRPGEIEARLGAAWIDTVYVQQFARELLHDSTIAVTCEGGSDWSVRNGTRQGVLAATTWGTDRMPAPRLLEALLTGRPIRVTDTVYDPEREREVEVFNQAATAAARDKATELGDRFSDWLWEDPERAEAAAATYNELLNNLVIRSYDGTSLSLPGLTERFEPREHQVAAVARIINEPAVLLAHEVGAGKTSEMVMGAMELRRLGLASKPAVVVPNHMLEQFADEWLKLYPAARILPMGMADLQGDKRREAVARVATGDWDGVILTRSAFEKMPVGEGTKASYRDGELQGLRASLRSARGHGDELSVKDIEARIVTAETRIRGKLDSAKDAGVRWEQTGIDYLFIDEAHAYKRLETRSRDRTLGIPDGSKRAEDLHMKIEYLRQHNDSQRVVTFATATPITNTLAEAYVMQQYLRPDLLRDARITDFDSWIATFAQQVTSMEVAPDGSGFREKTRLAKFFNVPELVRIFSVAADVKTADDLDLDTPDVRGGKAETVVVEATDTLTGYMGTLADRAEKVRGGSVHPKDDNMLSVALDGRKAALDLRLVEEEQPVPSKTSTLADRVAALYQEHRDNAYTTDTGEVHPTRGGLQLVFLDLSTPKKDEWNVYTEIADELTARGVPAEQIRWVQEAKNDAQKADLFDACREGKVSVLMGSSETMGVGTNVQTRAVALHHVDCHWLPAMIAQREGRIVRQGNQNRQVQILQYVTEGSFDAYMWQTVERKQRFITQIMRGRLDQREVEDIGEAALSYAEVKALATGNPLLMDKANADADLHRLERRERAYQTGRQSLHRTIEQAEATIGAHEQTISQITDAIAARQDTRGDAFRIRLDEHTSTSRPEAGEQLKHLLQPLVTSWTGTQRLELGELGGFTLTAEQIMKEGQGRCAQVGFTGIPTATATFTSKDLAQVAPTGLMTRLENKLAGLETTQDKLHKELDRARSERDRAQEQLEHPFPDADALRAARRRVQEIDDQLADTHSAAPPASSLPETPSAPAAASAPSEAPSHPADTRAVADTPAANTEPGPSRPSPPSDPSSSGPEQPDTTPAQRAAAAARATTHAPGENPPEAPEATEATDTPVTPAATSGSTPDEPATEQHPGPDAASPPHTAGSRPEANASRIRLEQNQHGYIVTGTKREDRDVHRALRSSGFRFSRRSGGYWYLPRDMLPRHQQSRVRTLVSELDKLGQQIDDTTTGAPRTQRLATPPTAEPPAPVPAASRRFAGDSPGW